MDNHELAEILKRLLDDEKFINSPQFTEIKEHIISVVTSSGDAIMQALNALYQALSEWIIDSIQPIAESIAEYLEKYLCSINNVPPRVRHLAFHNKKYKVRKKNYKRIYKRQKIP